MSTNQSINMKITPKSIWTILKHTAQGFSDDKVTRLSAALSYAAIFSFAPFILIITTIGAFIPSMGVLFCNNCLQSLLRLGQTNWAVKYIPMNMQYLHALLRFMKTGLLIIEIKKK